MYRVTIYTKAGHVIELDCEEVHITYNADSIRKYTFNGIVDKHPSIPIDCIEAIVWEPITDDIPGKVLPCEPDGMC